MTSGTESMLMSDGAMFMSEGSRFMSRSVGNWSEETMFEYKPTEDSMEDVGNEEQSGIRMRAAGELRPEMNHWVREVTEPLGVSAAAAAVLLRKHNWSHAALLEAYSENPDTMMRTAGVYRRCGHPIAPPETPTCGICYDDYDANGALAMPCGHAFCYECWHDFCVNAILEGPVCVETTCPHAGCTEAVTEEEMKEALGEGTPYMHKFSTYQIRSFVESHKLARWCPGPGCERVACAPSESAMESQGNVAHCDSCELTFCLKCGEEPHAPVTCKDLAKWNEKCRNESETANWIAANTKSCPKCTTRIEKNQGCNHMNCQICGHHFCWICMGDWNEHGEQTGGYYTCNRYDSGADIGQSNAAKAQRDLERYLHHYNRFHAHQEAEAFAKTQLMQVRAKMTLLQDSPGNRADVGFLRTANEQLVKCRGVLKYTYVVGYYLDCPGIQRERFEYHQEMLEKFTEKLSELAEKPVPEMDRTDLVNQTRVVDTFMKNILEYIEGGMHETIV